MASIQDLPEELLLNVIQNLEHDPPSIEHQREELSTLLLFATPQPLKVLSVVSRQWRRLVIPTLFKYMRLDLSNLIPFAHDQVADSPAVMSHGFSLPFLASTNAFSHFLREERVHGTVLSLTIYCNTDSSDLCTEYLTKSIEHSAGYTHRLIKFLWQRLLGLVQPMRLAILTPPIILGSLFGLHVDTTDAWSFSIECQMLELFVDQGRDVRDEHISYHADTSALNGLLTFNRWSHMHYNEGSSLNIYGTYHYFEKRPPCVLLGNPIELRPHVSSLTSFSYTAVFPHFVHFEELMGQLAKMSTLQKVSMQLAPSERSGVLSDSNRIGTGSLRLKDCWSELERCYMLIIGRLQREEVSWTHFESLDCVFSTLEADLQMLFWKYAAAWAQIGPNQWAKTLVIAIS